ncbi:MAG: DMT family transporter [Clostridiales bacterium]|nr:DMT family transporter [Clostridiales bacterium]
MAESGKHRLIFITTMLAFGTVGLFVRRVGLPSAEVSFWRAVIALAAIALFMGVTGRFGALKALRPQLWRFLVSGAVMAANWILLFEAIRHTSIALATLAYYLAPTLVILASVWLLRERVSPLQALCFALSTLGLVMMLGVSGGSAGDLRGILLALGSAVLYATVIMMNRAAGDADGVARTFVQFCAAALALLPYLAFGQGFQVARLDAGAALSLLVLGLFHTGICYCLYFTALPHLRGQQVAILSYLDPLVAVLLSVLLLGEHVSPLQLLGGGLMLLGALLNETLARRRRAAPADGRKEA